MAGTTASSRIWPDGRRGEKGQRLAIALGDRQAGKAAIRRPSGQILEDAVVPAVRPAQKKADAVIKHVGLRIDADADGEAAVCQFREMGEQGNQRRVEDAAILRCDDAVRAAFEESRGHPACKALQMEGGAAACVPGRDMR